MEEEKKSVNNTNLSAVKMVIFVDFSVGRIGIVDVFLVSLAFGLYLRAVIGNCQSDFMVSRWKAKSAR